MQMEFESELEISCREKERGQKCTRKATTLIARCTSQSIYCAFCISLVVDYLIQTPATCTSGPGECIESPTSTTVATPATPHVKTPLAMTTPTSATGTMPSLVAMPPDLDLSAMSIARDHLTSGSTSSVISFSGDYKDASGKVIRRYVM